MKIKIFSTLLVSLIIAFAAQAQDQKVTTCEFEVQGVCKMCKERIQEAAYIKGVKLAEWDIESGKFKAVFRNDKTTEELIHQAIADAGHTTEKLAANPDAYAALPNCCKYDDGIKKH